MNYIVSPQIIELFIEDLWKDNRRLEIEKLGGKTVLKRYADHETSIDDELRFLRVIDKTPPFKIPQILTVNEHFLTFQYIAGTRAYNLFFDLKRLYHLTEDYLFKAIARDILSLLDQDLARFQNWFKHNQEELKLTLLYPAQKKLTNLFRVLLEILPLNIQPQRIQPDLEIIAKAYTDMCEVPFRDASSKNMILNIQSLFPQKISSYKQRLETIKQLAKSGQLSMDNIQDKIYHIDFSGCLYLCPEEDDWIALNHHEMTDWLSDSSDKLTKKLSVQTLVTTFVRFMRFGGRKLAYRLLNKNGHQVRFGLDDERFYFIKLSQITHELAGRGVINGDALIECFQQLSTQNTPVVEKDYVEDFLEINGGTRYYFDVFPN